jgi:hypothetical protein
MKRGAPSRIVTRLYAPLWCYLMTTVERILNEKTAKTRVIPIVAMRRIKLCSSEAQTLAPLGYENSQGRRKLLQATSPCILCSNSSLA